MSRNESEGCQGHPTNRGWKPAAAKQSYQNVGTWSPRGKEAENIMLLSSCCPSDGHRTYKGVTTKKVLAYWSRRGGGCRLATSARPGCLKISLAHYDGGAAKVPLSDVPNGVRGG